MSQVLANADTYLANPSEYDEVYERGAFQDGYRELFLGPGMATNWKALNAKLNRLPAGVKVGFRIIGYANVPDGWPTINVGGREYIDFSHPKVREEYPKMLRNFKATCPRVTWLDIPFCYSGSDEPSIDEDDAKALPGGKERYFADCKWVIDQYVEVFGRALVGNFISPGWIRIELLPYMKAKGILAFRQDAFMRFDWDNSGKDAGENRETLYDRANVLLGGRDTYYRAIFEQNGNGLNADGRDQKYKTLAPIEMMFGKEGAWNGEYYQLEGTDYFNMGLPGRKWCKRTDKADRRLKNWYDYIGVGNVPIPTPTPVPTPSDSYRFPIKILGGELGSAVFGGPYPTIIYPDGVNETVVEIPVNLGVRWNPRVFLKGEGSWTIDPIEPKKNDDAISFHCEGRDYAVVTFDGYEEPSEPVLTPDPVPDLSEIVARIKRLEDHNSSWGSDDTQT